MFGKIDLISFKTLGLSTSKILFFTKILFFMRHQMSDLNIRFITFQKICSDNAAQIYTFSSDSKPIKSAYFSKTG